MIRSTNLLNDEVATQNVAHLELRVLFVLRFAMFSLFFLGVGEMGPEY